MKLNKNEKSTILDGSLQDEFKAVEKFLSKLTPEEIERSMSDEFAYLDDDDE